MAMARRRRCRCAARSRAPGLLPRDHEPARCDRSRPAAMCRVRRRDSRAGAPVSVRGHGPAPCRFRRVDEGGDAMNFATPGHFDRTVSDVVLIVDDVPDNLSVLHDALDESGYTVLVATSGEAALQRASQAVPDIVLLDAMMPGLDGFEVAKRLKASPLTAHIPIIFMTGLTE